VRDRKCSGGILNAFMVSEKNNSIFKKCINKIIENVKNRDYGTNPLDPTGPLLMKQFFTKKELRRLKAYPEESEETIIYYQKTYFLTAYEEYRKEQKQFGSAHYDLLWQKRNVYK
jgi:hypothetical protein